MVLPEDNIIPLVEQNSVFPEINYLPGMALDPEAANPVVQTAWGQVRDELADFLLAPEFAATMETAFGPGVNLESGRDDIKDILTGESLPSIRVLPAADMYPAVGAFDSLTGTVYLADSLLGGTSGGDNGVVVDVLLEELGHYLDGLLHESDSPGDEGELWGRLVRGEVLSESEVVLLWGEDDRVEIMDGGVLVEVEASEEVDFEEVGRFDVGNRPLSVAVGEFNGDGTADLAVTNFFGDNVSVLLGEGDGSFGQAANFDVGDGPSSLAVGELNGDGIYDLAVANRYSDNVSVLLGEGNGSFDRAINFDAGEIPYSVAVGEFNGDGIADFAAANRYLDKVSVLLGEGDGSFGLATNFDVGYSPQSVAVGEFNGDDISDLAVANKFSDNVSVLLGQGDGSFGQATNFDAGEVSYSVAVGEFNGDGIADLAVANNNSDNVSVLLGKGDGSFDRTTNFDVGSRPRSVAVGDFDRDDTADLAVANWLSGNLSVLLGEGDGSFGLAANFDVGDRPRSVAVGEFNGDDIPDLAVANADSDNVSILISKAPIIITPNITISDTKITEGNTNKTAKFTVTLDNPSNETVKVNYTTANQTAKVNRDYKRAKGTLTFQPGETEKTITVPILGDKRDERNEKFKVNLSKPQNAQLQDKQAIGTIVDNDKPPKLSIGDATLTEGNQGQKKMEFEVKLNNPSSQTVKVNYATADGSAKSGEDFQKKRGVLTFKPGQKQKTISIPVLGDTRDENNEQFQVNLSRAKNAKLSDKKAVGVIQDNDEKPKLKPKPVPEIFKDADNLGVLSVEQISVHDRVGFSDGPVNRDTEDYFRFEVEKEGFVSIFVDGFVQDLKIDLYGDDESLINQSNEEGDTGLEAIEVVLEPGVYYLEVSPVGGGRTKYNLNVNIVEL